MSELIRAAKGANNALLDLEEKEEEELLLLRQHYTALAESSKP